MLNNVALSQRRLIPAHGQYHTISPPAKLALAELLPMNTPYSYGHLKHVLHICINSVWLESSSTRMPP
jgi:hypothetical protein